MRWLRPLVAYLAAAVVTTWPLAIHPSSLLGATSGPGDPYLNLWILGWGMQAVLTHPAWLANGAVFNANIFHPATATLAYSDHLLLQSVVLAPLYAVTGDVVLCYNVLLLASLVASALAMHVFVREVIGSRLDSRGSLRTSESGAYLAGLAWGFGSFHFAHLIHLQLQSLYFLPLTFLFLHRVIAARRRRDVAMLGLTAALQAWSSVYWGVIGGVALVAGGMALATGVGRWRNVAVYKRLSCAAALGVVLVLPIVFVYGAVARREGFGRNLYEASRNAAYVSSYVQAPPGNILYGRTEVLRLHDTASTGNAPPRTGPERELFPGFVLIALAVAGAWLGWRGDARATVIAMVVVAAVGFVLSLGPDGVRPLYAALHRFVFGFPAVRAPARFSVLVMFGLSVLAAMAIEHLRQRGLHRVAFVLLAVAALEWLHVPPQLAAAPRLHTDVGQWLAREPGSGAVAILPLGLDIDSTPAMVASLEHRRPIVNGYSGQRPSFYGPMVEAINAFPGPDALIALHDGHVRFVVTPEPIAPSEPPEPRSPAEPYVERARFAGGTIYELRWTPELEARLAATAAVEPPAPGAIPFRVGELARYKIDWGGAGVNLSAGEISIGVESPAYRLVVKATTAPWVAQFFEARDVFTTQADGELLPRTHERDQNEGSRHVTRAFIFDHTGRVVRMARTVEEARASGAVVLPMPAGARDAIAALFYARTLPMTAGNRVRFPVNEAGRNVIVELAVDGLERITVQGKTVEAIRATPTLQRRAEDRRAFTSTLWLSNDERRVPLMLDLDAGFGHLRVELVSYSAGF